MKIEFGCGANPTKEGFLTCDIRDLPGIDFVCPAWEIVDQVEPNSVDEIFSRHFLEHLTFVQADKLVGIWFIILKSGGVCELAVPNMEYHIAQWIKGKNMDHARAGFWGHQREGEFEVWDVHKSGYNQRTLTELFISKGFVNPKSHKKPTNKHLWMSFTKP